MARQLITRTVTANRFIPEELNGYKFPSVPQAFFLSIPHREALYGGAAGGGKSAALLAGALQYVDVPGYSAILFRRTLTDLEMPGSLIPMSHEWLAGTGAKWDGSLHKWTFPSSAVLSFGYMKDENDHFRYKSSAFQYIGFDELTGFKEHPYRFLFGRARKPLGMPVPVRVRSASNPGDLGHEWVKQRFLCGGDDDRIFIPAKLDDNPGLDRVQYERMLDVLDPVTRAQMRHGDWNIRPEGNLFKRVWFGPPVQAPGNLRRIIRYWDLAATEEGHGKDPDWTTSAKLGESEDRKTIYLMEVIRVRARPHEVESLVKQTAAIDGRQVSIRAEQEPGASGKSLISHYARDVLNGFDFRGVPSLRDKVSRANPASAACERGDVKLVQGEWIGPFLDELCAFPAVAHDDQVDAFTGGYNELTNVINIDFATAYTVGSASNPSHFSREK